MNSCQWTDRCTDLLYFEDKNSVGDDPSTLKCCDLKNNRKISRSSSELKTEMDSLVKKTNTQTHTFADYRVQLNGKLTLEVCIYLYIYVAMHPQLWS